MNIYSASTKKALSRIKLEKGCSYIFDGDKGLGKSLAAREIIAEKLDCTDLSVQPDVLIIEPDEGSIKIDQIREINDFMMYLPANGEVKYVLIDDADTMLVGAQNALLKSLEESAYTIFFLITHEPVLLDTIQSRSKKVSFTLVTDEELKQWIQVQGMQVDDFVLSLCGGRVGLYMSYAYKDNSFVKESRTIFTGMSHFSKRRELFELFYCVKEKDKNMFFEKYETSEIKLFLNLLRTYFYRAMLELAVGTESKDLLVLQLSRQYSVTGITQIIERLTSDSAMLSKKGAYNKNDFFDLVRFLTIVE